MPLACLADVRDPALFDEVFHLHCTYQAQIPNIAENYVRSLWGKPAVIFAERPDKQVVLSNGMTATQMVLQRCSSTHFKTFVEICDGVTNTKERHHVAWILCKMLKRGRVQRIGKRPHCMYRLV
jgi:hypothetical protein